MSLSVLDEDVPCVLAGTKSDLAKIDPSSIEAMSSSFHKWYYTSAKTGTGVKEMFEDLTRQMIEYENRKLNEERFNASNVRLSGGSGDRRKACSQLC